MIHIHMKELQSLLIDKAEYYSCEFLVMGDTDSIKRRIEWVASTRDADSYLSQLSKNEKIIELLFSNIDGYFLVTRLHFNQYKLTIYAQDNTTDNSADPS